MARLQGLVKAGAGGNKDAVIVAFGVVDADIQIAGITLDEQ